MKLVTFMYDGRTRVGAVVNGTVVDLRRAYARYLRDVAGDGAAERVAAVLIPDDMVTFLERHDASWEAAEQALAYAAELETGEEPWQGRVRYHLNEVRLERPLTPRTILAAGPKPATSAPRLDAFREFYVKPPTSVVGPHDAVRAQPDITTQLTPEAEVGLIFIGGGRHLAPDEALENLFGLTIFLDLIAPERLIFGWEGTTMFHTRYGEGASFDTSGVLGPWIVTRDELPDLDEVTVQLYVNDELQKEHRLADLWWPITEYVSYLSTFFPLEPAIVGTSGVPYGATYGPDEAGNPVITLDDPAPAVDVGDRIRVDVDGVGRLETSVVEPMMKGVHA